MTKITVVLGSVTPPGRLSAAISGAAERARTRGHETSFLDLGAMTLGFADGRPLEQLQDDTRELVERVSGGEAIILATPVYRGTLTGALKNALDLLPIETMQGKPAGIVAMGATLHHYLGAESHLRDILAWFGAFTLPTGVYLSSADFSDGALSAAAARALDDLFDCAGALAGAVSNLPAGPPPLAAPAARQRT